VLLLFLLQFAVAVDGEEVLFREMVVIMPCYYSSSTMTSNNIQTDNISNRLISEISATRALSRYLKKSFNDYSAKSKRT
jgi:hypothetical protein